MRQRGEEVQALGLLDVVVLPAVRDEDRHPHLGRVLAVVALLPEGVVVGRRVVAVLGGEFLSDLDAAPVAVHVAEAADIHEYVETELLPGAEGPQHLVMLAPVAQAAIDNLLPQFLAGSANRLSDLAVRIMAVLVKQRGRQL